MILVWLVGYTWLELLARWEFIKLGAGLKLLIDGAPEICMEGFPDMGNGGTFLLICLKVIWCVESTKLRLGLLLVTTGSTLIPRCVGKVWLSLTVLKFLLFCKGRLTDTFRVKLRCLLCIGISCCIVWLYFMLLCVDWEGYCRSYFS